jgi:hypothetical protein
MSGRCGSLIEQTKGAELTPCTGVPVGTFMAACRCGHLSIKDLCASCRDVRSAVQTPLCIVCHRAENSHECAMTRPIILESQP